MRFSRHARQRMIERSVTESEATGVANNQDVTFTDKKGNPCYVREVGNRRIKVVVAADDREFVITVVDLDA